MPVLPSSAISWSMGRRAMPWGPQTLDCTSRNSCGVTSPRLGAFLLKTLPWSHAWGRFSAKPIKGSFYPQISSHIIHFGARTPIFDSLQYRPPDAPNCTTFLGWNMFPAAEKWAAARMQGTIKACWFACFQPLWDLEHSFTQEKSLPAATKRVN